MKKKIRIAGTMLMWAFSIGPVNQAFALVDSQNVWQDVAYLQKQKADAILDELPGLSTEQVAEYLAKKGAWKLMLTQYLAQCERAAAEGYSKYDEARQQDIKRTQEEITRLEKQVQEYKGAERKRAKFLLDEAQKNLKAQQAEAAKPMGMSGCAKVLNAICADEEWMNQIAFSGEMQKFGRVVQMIDYISKNDPSVLKKGVERDIVTATALEFTRNDWSLADARKRAQYFLKYRRLGRLNSSFETLPLHHRRVACGWKNNHSSGTVKAFEWALNNVHIPDWQYTACCWRCGYIEYNMFGDSVQGPWYVAPFVGVYSDNHMAFTKNVGGVCGGLSHFGAAAACANGVPALTAGEPGHCAYIVLVDGKWVPAYSLSWERGLHWYPWPGNDTFSSLYMTDALYEPKAEAATRLSNAYRILARIWADKGDLQKTRTCYEQAAAASPYNYPMWREYMAFLRHKMPRDAEAWKSLNKALCEGLASAYPEQASVLFNQGIYDGMSSCGMSAEDLVDACELFWKNAATMGPDRWYIERFLNRQLDMCKKAGGGAESVVCDFYAKVMAAGMPHDAYSGTLMAWGNNVASGLSPEARQKVTNALLDLTGQSKEMSSEQRAKMLGGLILAAERSGDVATFHAISRMVDPKEIHGTAAIPSPTPFPGKLVSEGGMPFASSTSEWDAPHTHSGLLTQQGGRIHTGKDTNAWIAVKLPKHAYITGVVFAGTNEWKIIGRFRPMQIQVSDTGREDDWHNVGEPIPSTANYINRFDLQKERPKALYVRVLRPGGPEVFHANGIYVYGEPAA